MAASSTVRYEKPYRSRWASTCVDDLLDRADQHDGQIQHLLQGQIRDPGQARRGQRPRGRR